MPQIPTFTSNAPRQKNIGVRMAQDAGTAPFKALQDLSAASKDVAQVLEKIELQRLEIKNKGDVAEAQRRITETNANIDARMQQEQDHNKWSKIQEEEYAKLDDEFGKKNYSPAARLMVDDEYKSARARSNATILGQQVKRDVQVANANIMQRAHQLLLNGDRKGAQEWLEQINADPETKQRLIQQVMSEGVYGEIYQSIEAHEDSIENLEKIGKSLRAKEGEAYTNHEGLGYEARLSLESMVDAKIKRKKASMAREAINIENKIKKDEMTIAEIALARNNQEISEGQAAYLTNQLVVEERTERLDQGGEFVRINDLISDNIGQGIAGFKTPDEEFYNSAIMEIVNAKGVSKGNKAKLFERVTQAQIWDLSDGAVDKDGQYKDRKVSPWEVDIRQELMKDLQQNVHRLGVKEAGEKFLTLQAEIEQWFDERPGWESMNMAETKSFLEQKDIMYKKWKSEIQEPLATQTVDVNFMEL